MTTELKQAIGVLKKNILEHLFSTSTLEEAIYTVVAELEKPTYTAEDMEAFFSWATDNGWSYGELTELWYNYEEDLEGLIIEDVIKLWEESE